MSENGESFVRHHKGKVCRGSSAAVSVTVDLNSACFHMYNVGSLLSLFVT